MKRPLGEDGHAHLKFQRLEMPPVEDSANFPTSPENVDNRRDGVAEFYSKYEPKEILGRGMASLVRRCVEKSTGREFAVKIIDLSTPSPDEARDLLIATSREAEFLRRLGHHPNLCRFQDAFFTDSYMFLVLELCSGGELFDYLNSVVTLSERKARHVMRQILSAVEFVHSAGIIHRDLKPENVLLKYPAPPKAPPHVKVSDFGFSHQTSSPTERLRDLCGTPTYMAPEMLSASMDETAPGYGKEVDLWAVGVILFILLSGVPPFWHRRQMKLIRLITEGKFSFEAPEWTDISGFAKDLVTRLLTTNPARRITAAEALQHPFFSAAKDAVPEEDLEKEENEKREKRKRAFSARRKFRVAFHAVRFIVRLTLAARDARSKTVSVGAAIEHPYRYKVVRQKLDAFAFKVYGHWVKKDDQQNRMTMYQNQINSEEFARRS